MDREKAIQILKRCEAESYCSHYKRHYCCIGCGQREALDLAIEALKEPTRDELGDCNLCRFAGSTNCEYCINGSLWSRGDAESAKLKKPCDSLLTADSDECKEQESKLESDLISRHAIEYHTQLEARGNGQYEEVEVAYKSAIESLPPVDPKPKCEDAISREWILKELNAESEKDYPSFRRVMDKIEDAPPVTPTERTGEWVFRTDIPISGGGSSAGYICSNCGEDYFKVDRYRYCPDCGAKMDGDKE